MSFRHKQEQTIVNVDVQFVMYSLPNFLSNCAVLQFCKVILLPHESLIVNFVDDKQRTKGKKIIYIYIL